MPRILTTCPSSRLPAFTGYRAPSLDLATLIGERSFRCKCGVVHVWSASTAWVEDPRSMDEEMAAEMTHLAEYMAVPAVEDEPVSAMALQARQARARRQGQFRPW